MANNKNKDSQKDTSKEIKIEDNSQETIKEKVEANEVETDATNEEATDEINELKEQLASLQDKYLRQIAEFDNYRKRILKEKSELILNGGEKVISSLLPVLDDFERALINIKKVETKQPYCKALNLYTKNYCLRWNHKD